MAMKINAAVYCHIGRRANNEDNFYADGQYLEREQMNKGGKLHRLNSEDQQIYAVCDGMGGAEFGEEASLRAVRAIKAFQETSEQPDNTEQINKMVSALSENIDDISLSKGMPSGSSGSTMAMIVIKDWYYRTVHVGDSRVYLLRDQELKRLTRDDSEVQDLVDLGRITLDEAWQHPRKNVITRHLGMPMDGEPLYPTISQRTEIKPGDRFILCSDGLSDALHDTMIREIAVSHSEPEQAAEQLARTALADSDNAGIASDNITVIVLDVIAVNQKDTDMRRTQKWGVIRVASALAAGAAFAGFAYSAYNLCRLLMH